MFTLVEFKLYWTSLFCWVRLTITPYCVSSAGIRGVPEVRHWVSSASALLNWPPKQNTNSVKSDRFDCSLFVPHLFIHFTCSAFSWLTAFYRCYSPGSKLQFSKLPAEVPVMFRVVELPQKHHICKVKSLNKGDANSEVTVYYQVTSQITE